MKSNQGSFVAWHMDWILLSILSTHHAMFRHNLLLFCYVAFAQNTETRKVDSFNKLEAGGTFDVVLEQGNENVITIEAKGVDTDFWQMVWVEGLSQSMTLQSLDIKVPLEELYLKTENL